MRTVLCEGCEGAGWIIIQNTRRRCRVCDGEGRMMMPDDASAVAPLAFTVAAILAIIGALHLFGIV